MDLYFFSVNVVVKEIEARWYFTYRLLKKLCHNKKNYFKWK